MKCRVLSAVARLLLGAMPSAAPGRGGGGCLEKGSSVLTPSGPVSVEDLRPGSTVLSFSDKRLLIAEVQAVIAVDADAYYEITVGRHVLRLTGEHPIATAPGVFRTASSLQAGDRVLIGDQDGVADGAVESVKQIPAKGPAYNLLVSPSGTYLANGIVVHNKGCFLPETLIRKEDGSEVPISSVRPKDRLLAFTIDGELVSVRVRTVVTHEVDRYQVVKTGNIAVQVTAEHPFLKLQQCWSARSYEPMRPLLMPDLFRNHSIQIAQMVRNHETNVIGDLRVDRIDLVNVRYTFKEEQREFTALITATACDYYLDDRTRKRLRGDTVPSQFQEFWTFQFHNKTWILREVEQTRESEALKVENFFEQFTDTGVEQIYGAEAAHEGQAGPGLEKAVQTKETHIERMLNFLVQTDRIWDRQAMLETTRRVFLEMMAARESGNPADVPDGDLFPELAAHLKEEIARNEARGVAVELRNLCVRKVELILVRNFADNTQDEFVARVRAHAQKILRRNGQVRGQDEDVVPFEQYLTLGRLNNGWKLKEILSAEAGQAAVKEENLDQDSSPEQVQWYYQHGRAV